MKSKPIVNLGVIGFGYIARKHVRAYQRVANAKVNLLAVCDKNGKCEELVKRELGNVRFYSDPETMLTDLSLDVVHISTPPQMHAPLSILCMKKGCHVVVEKPMATTVSDCDRMIRVMKENGVRLVALHTSLFNPAFLRLKEMICKGELGEIFAVDANFLGSSYEPFIVDAHHWSHSLPGGAFCESLPHPLYLVQALLPKMDVEAVFWKKHGSLVHMVANDLCVLLKGDSASATIRLGWNSPRNVALVRVYGTKAHADVDIHSLTLVKHERQTVSPFSLGMGNLRAGLSIFSGVARGFFKWTTGGWRGGYQTLIPRIVKCVVEGGPSPVNVEDAREVVRLMENICAEIPSNKSVARARTEYA